MNAGHLLLARMVLVAAAIFAVRCAHAADPSTADCLEASDASLEAHKSHKLLAERAQLLACAAPTCPTEIRKECGRRIDDVNAAIPTLVFEAKDASGNDLSEIRVTVDGALVAVRLDGSALSIDPGMHSFAFEGPGHPPLTKELVVLEAQKERRETIRFADLAEPPSSRVSRPGPTALGARPPDAIAGRGISVRGALAVASAGLGVAALGAGTVFGLVAASRADTARRLCPNDCIDQNGVDAWNNAKTAADIATALFIVGGTGVGVAATLWLAGRPQGTLRGRVSLGLGGISVRGTW